MAMRQVITRYLVALSLLATSTPAAASVAFPEAIKQQLELAVVPAPAPGCRLCHQSDAGGIKTVNKPFGRTMVGLGATASSVPALLGALDAAETAASDSDGDGTADVTELRDGTDPNVAAESPDGGVAPSPIDDVPLPQTGCGVARGEGANGAVAAVFSLALVLLRRRRWG